MPRPHHLYRSWLADEGQVLAATLHGNPTTPVPSCPGWSLTDLVAHVGSYHRWAADLLHDASPQPRAPYSLNPDPDGTLADWYRASLELLLKAVDSTDPDTPMWTVTIDQKAGAWCRRQSHDLTVHRWDAQNARGHAQPIHPQRAADFIDELFEAALPYILPFLGRPVPEASLALRSADGTYSRRIDAATGQPHLSHDRTPADAILTGTPSDLLLALWRRDNATTHRRPDRPSRLATSHRRKHGRVITIHPHEARLQHAKTAQRDPSWRQTYRTTRPTVERKIAHFTRRPWGGRKARCRGRARILTDFLTPRRRDQPRESSCSRAYFTPGGWAIA